MTNRCVMLLVAIIVAVSWPIGVARAQPIESDRVRELRTKATSELRAGLSSSEPAKRASALREARYELIHPTVAFELITRSTSDSDPKVQQEAYYALVRIVPGGYEQTGDFLARRSRGEFNWHVDTAQLPKAKRVGGKIVLTEESKKFVRDQRRIAIVAFASLQPKFRSQIAITNKGSFVDMVSAFFMEAELKRQTRIVLDQISDLLASADEPHPSLLKKCRERLSSGDRSGAVPK